MSHPVLAGLAHPDPAQRRAACRAAPEDPAAALLVDALAEALGDPAKAVSRAASDALVAIERSGHGDRALHDALRAALHSDLPARRFAAAYTSVRLGPPHPGLLPPLVEALASTDGDVRWAAAKILVDMGRLHGEVLGVVLGLVRGADAAPTRRMAAFCLRELAPDRPESARVLLEATHDADLQVRRAAFTALAALLDAPREVGERLRAALATDPDPSVRRIAAVALGELAAQEPGGLDDVSRAALRDVAEHAADLNLRRAAERALARGARAELAANDVPTGGSPA